MGDKIGAYPLITSIMGFDRQGIQTKSFFLGGIMKKLFIIAALAWMVAATSCVWAAEDLSRSNSIRMQNIIYGATIDSKASFYQKRIYLVDSEFKILSDIGNDAVKKISFLKAYRQKLIGNMAAKNVKLNTTHMNSFLGTKIHNISASIEAYSTE